MLAAPRPLWAMHSGGSSADYFEKKEDAVDFFDDRKEAVDVIIVAEVDGAASGDMMVDCPLGSEDVFGSGLLFDLDNVDVEDGNDETEGGSIANNGSDARGSADS